MTNTELRFYDLVPMNLKSIMDELNDINKNLIKLTATLEKVTNQYQEKLND